MNNYKAIVIGGTGGVGAFLVEKLLASDQCAEVTVISRKPLPKSPKLNNVIWGDFSEHLSKEGSAEVFKNHDVLFCCLGAPEKALLGLFFNKKKYAPLFQKVDYDYAVGAARLAREVGIRNFSVISSPSAKPMAKFIYSKIKWQMEQAIKTLDFEKVSIFRPYHLMKPAKKHVSFFKKLIQNLVAFVARIMPAKERAIKVEDVAMAMMLEFEFRREDNFGIAYLTSDAMRQLVMNTESPLLISPQGEKPKTGTVS